MIVLFTDFGVSGPYMGQMKAVLARQAPGVPVIDLFADVPAFSAKSGAYLLPAYTEEFPPGSVFLCVVDPGVGTAMREPVVLRADARWYVGPGNGLMELVARRAHTAQWWRLTWRPDHLSATFHGRDLFAPVAAELALGGEPRGQLIQSPGMADGWPDDLPEVIYIDGYGNVVTGLRGGSVAPGTRLIVKGQFVDFARTFGEVQVGEVFWYANANGLIELAVNQGRADRMLDVAVGTPVTIVT